MNDQEYNLERGSAGRAAGGTAIQTAHPDGASGPGHVADAGELMRILDNAVDTDLVRREVAAWRPGAAGRKLVAEAA